MDGNSGILRDKTMDYKLINIPQSYTLSKLKYWLESSYIATLVPKFEGQETKVKLWVPEQLTVHWPLPSWC